MASVALGWPQKPPDPPIFLSGFPDEYANRRCQAFFCSSPHTPLELLFYEYLHESSLHEEKGLFAGNRCIGMLCS